ncbi:hypothetical protein [Flavobacterium sp. JP2137]|uniref:hypothetical protein n=1 Tax=Flavobacterium sp. JP2137 TaxID=3414510 RepID=UPI003D2FFDA1
MKHYSKLGLFVLIILVPICIWMQKKAIERGKEFFLKFYSAEINSPLEAVRIVNHGAGISLKDGQEFVFYPYTNKVLNDNDIFDYTAEKGDIIIKPAYSDTLFLIKKDVKRAYLFKKF